MDLDWFWRGWFYSTDHVDISLDRVVKMRLDTSDPEIEKAWEREQQQAEPTYRFGAKNEAAGLVQRTERYPELKDLYAENDEFTVTNKDRNGFDEFLEGLVDKNDSDPEGPAEFTSALWRKTPTTYPRISNPGAW